MAGFASEPAAELAIADFGLSLVEAEARRMVLGYRVFEGQGFDEVLAAMARRRWLAKLLLAVVWRRARRG